MFRNTFQKGFLSVFYSIGSKPLLIWDVKVSHGHVKRLTDEDSKSLSLDIRGVNIETCYITAPASPCTCLGIKLPFVTIIVKNLRKFFSFEIQILDDRDQLRRFRFSNYQKKTRVNNFSANMPLALNCGWNQIQMNLVDFTRRAYGTNYMETVRITVHANCRLRNIYFSDRLYSDDEKPIAFKFIAKDEDKKVEPKRFSAKEVVEQRLETVRPSSPVSHYTGAEASGGNGTQVNGEKIVSELSAVPEIDLAKLSASQMSISSAQQIAPMEIGSMKHSASAPSDVFKFVPQQETVEAKADERDETELVPTESVIQA